MPSRCNQAKEFYGTPRYLDDFSKVLPLLGRPEPYCNNDGSFVAQQCTGTVCVCVSPSTGAPGTNSEHFIWEDFDCDKTSWSYATYYDPIDRILNEARKPLTPEYIEKLKDSEGEPVESDTDNSDMDKSDMDKSDTDESDMDKSDMDISDMDKSDADESDMDESKTDKPDMDKPITFDTSIKPYYGVPGSKFNSRGVQHAAHLASFCGSFTIVKLNFFF